MSITERVLLLFAFCVARYPAMAQVADSARHHTDVTGLVTVTNKGISTIPSFTLGKPAAIFNLYVTRRAMSFEPEIKYGLDGKPWTFVFWWRYKALDSGKGHIQLGGHPAVAFRTIPAATDGSSPGMIAARRYLAGEVNASYALARHIAVGTYYLYSYGVEEDAARNTHFVSLRANVTNVRLSDVYTMRFFPQVYYLKVDNRDGYYLNGAATLARRNFPFSISSMVNTTIRSTVVQKDDVLWNLSLTYAIK